MKRFSAQYIITGTGSILKRGIITTDDEGLITDVTDTGGSLPELQNTAFYNGIISPGFVNCHCHLELSAMKGMLPGKQGLGKFIRDVRDKRTMAADKLKHARIADREMYDSGISACADICNTPDTFRIKDESALVYLNLLEVFGIDPGRIEKRLQDITLLKGEASGYRTSSYIVPHSLYSLSSGLLVELLKITRENRVTSIHFMESDAEKEFLSHCTGSIAESYKSMGITGEMLTDRVRDHISGILSMVTLSGNLLLVHNTFSGSEEIDRVMERGNTFWCLCPSSNIYIENSLPPVQLLRDRGAKIVLGTDSLASNSRLSILEEMKLIASGNRGIPLGEIIIWATANGAEALDLSESLGTIETGKRPGLVLLENISLEDMALTPEVTARRLI